jgi:beta-lactamase regulating signal transducer with metallopeptidase domain
VTQEDFGWLLVHSMWQTGFIALALWVVLRALTSAKARHRACWSAVTLVCALTLFTWQQDLFRAVVMVEFAPGAAAGSGIALPDAVAMLFWVWLAVVIPGLARLVMAGVYRRLRHGAPAVTWQRTANRVAAEMGVPRVTLGKLPRLDGPMTYGTLRPVVCIPDSLEHTLTEAQMQFVLAHELAHVKRRDALSLTLQRIIEVVFVYQPALCWITRQIHIEREYCCDDIAVEYTGDPLGYARTLTELEKIRIRPAAFSPALGSIGGQLWERIRRVAERTTPNARVNRSTAVAAASMMLFAAVMMQAQPDRMVPAIESPQVQRAVLRSSPRTQTIVRVRPIAPVRRPEPRAYVPPSDWISSRPVDWADQVDALPEAPPAQVAQLVPPVPATTMQMPAAPDPPSPPMRRIVPLPERKVKSMRMGLFTRLRIRREVNEAVNRSLLQLGIPPKRLMIPRRPFRPLIICRQRCSPHVTI